MSPEDAEIVAGAFEDRRRGRVKSIDEGLGLDSNWPGTNSVLQRNEALRELIAATAGVSGRKRAQAIFDELRRYASGGFSQDAERPLEPDGRRGLMFRVMVANSGKSPGLTTIRNLVPRNLANRTV